MAIFHLQIGDDDVNMVFDAVCSNYGWDENAGETQGEFTHKIVRQFLSDNVTAYEREKAREEATASLNTKIQISDPEG